MKNSNGADLIGSPWNQYMSWQVFNISSRGLHQQITLLRKLINGKCWVLGRWKTKERIGVIKEWHGQQSFIWFLNTLEGIPRIKFIPLRKCRLWVAHAIVVIYSEYCSKSSDVLREVMRHTELFTNHPKLGLSIKTTLEGCKARFIGKFHNALQNLRRNSINATWLEVPI